MWECKIHPQKSMFHSLKYNKISHVDMISSSSWSNSGKRTDLVWFLPNSPTNLRTQLAWLPFFSIAHAHTPAEESIRHVCNWFPHRIRFYFHFHEISFVIILSYNNGLLKIHELKTLHSILWQTKIQEVFVVPRAKKSIHTGGEAKREAEIVFLFSCSIILYNTVQSITQTSSFCIFRSGAHLPEKQKLWQGT